MGAKALLVRRLRGNQADADDRLRADAPVAGALLQFPQLAAQPDLVGGAVEDQRALAGSQVFLVILANLGFVAGEDRVNDFAVGEEEVRPWTDRGGVTLVVDQIEMRNWRR